MTFTHPSSVTMTLLGFRSPWTMSFWCAYHSASAMPSRMGRAMTRSMPAPFGRLEHALQGLAGEVLHRHEHRLPVAIDVDDADDVRVSQALQLRGFALQRRERAGVVPERAGEHFDGDVHIVLARFHAPQVDGLVDAAHAALAHALHELEAMLEHRPFVDTRGAALAR